MTKRQVSGRGYWRIVDYVWHLNVDKLADVLQGSGTAQVSFALDVNMDLKFGLLDRQEKISQVAFVSNGPERGERFN